MKIIIFIFAVLFLLSSNSPVNAQREVPENPDGYYDLMFNKMIQGYEYMAAGNEPFWYLDLDVEGNLVFNLASINEITTIPISEMTVTENENSISFSSEAKSFKAEFTLKDCFDDMSGNQYDYKVTITYQGTELYGCGNKLDGWALNDIFALIEIEGQPVKEMKLQNQPMIELHLRDKKIMGNDGCNTFNGGIIYAIFGKIKFNEGFVSTKMFCVENGGFEIKFYSALKSADSYTFKKLRLKFFSEGKEVLEFVKMD